MSGAPKTPERRLNLLTGDWVLVSPQRLGRPWQGETGAPQPAHDMHHDPDCYLCPGSARANGARNPAYEGVYVFDNDFPALSEGALPPTFAADDVLRAEPETGLCRVICYTPDHSRTMARMSPAELRAVVDAWAAQFAALDARPGINVVTIFENRGAMMGASNPHPHGQIWANLSVPNELAREDARQREWLAEKGEPLLTSYLRRELEAGERIVLANDHFVALVPFWASWPFETLVMPRRAVDCLPSLSGTERDALGDILGRLTRAYDALFGVPFPYSMGFHQRPSGTREADHFTLHAHFYPPLLRSASVRKFMVGYEMLAMPQRDLSPEEAAERLRARL